MAIAMLSIISWTILPTMIFLLSPPLYTTFDLYEKDLSKIDVVSILSLRYEKLIVCSKVTKKESFSVHSANDAFTKIRGTKLGKQERGVRTKALMQGSGN